MLFKNIIANFFGKFWSVLANFIFLPIYINILGIENFSVISFSLIILGFASLLDTGFSAVLSREFASKSNSNIEKLQILNTLEFCYWGIVVLIISVLYFGANYIVYNFINTVNIDEQELVCSIQIIGLTVSFQMLSSFYMGGLLGLEHQIKANIFQVIYGVFRSAIVIIVIYFLPNLIAFFAWQAFVTLIYVVLLRQSIVKILKNSISSNTVFKIDKQIIKKKWKFAAGMSLISFVAVINTQTDKLLISKLLPLEELGYYSLSLSLTQILIVIISPFSIALLPRLTALLSEKKFLKAFKLYYHFFLFVSILVFSMAVSLFFNGYRLIYIWTGNSEIAERSSFLMPFLTLGSLALSLQIIPFNVSIASGSTKIYNICGVISLFFTLPLYYLSINKYGALGTATVWMLAQIIVTPIYVKNINIFFYKVNIPNKIYYKLILFPLMIAIFINCGVSFLLPTLENRFFDLIIVSIPIFLSIVFSVIILFEQKQLQTIALFVKKLRW